MPELVYTATRDGISMTVVDNWISIALKDGKNVDFQTGSKEETQWIITMHKNETLRSVLELKEKK